MKIKRRPALLYERALKKLFVRILKNATAHFKIWSAFKMKNSHILDMPKELARREAGTVKKIRKNASFFIVNFTSPPLFTREFRIEFS